MRKIKALCIVTIIISLFFVACSSNDKKTVENNDEKVKSAYNPFDLSNEKGNNELAFYFGPASKVEELSYTGETIEKDYFYDNVGEVDCTLGFMIFVDGIAQPYTIDGGDSEKIMHQFNMQEKSKTQFKVSFNPNVGEKGDKLGLYAVTILNPTYIPSIDLPVFGHGRALSQVSPITLNYIESASNSELKINDEYSTEIVTEEIKKEYLSVSEDNKEEYLSPGAHLFFLKYNGDYKETKIAVKKNSKLNLTLEGLCALNDAKYRTTIFIDNKPVKTIDGKDYLEMQLKKGMISKQSFDVDISGLTGTNALYTVSVPLGDDYSKITNSIFQTKPRLLIIEE